MFSSGARWIAPIVWLLVAALVGYSAAQIFGILGNRAAATLPPWMPPALARDATPSELPAPVTAQATSGQWQLVGIAEGRVYIRVNNKPASFGEGETLPNGDVIKRIERDAVTVSNSGKESRIALYKFAAPPTAPAAPATGAAVPAPAATCRLSASDRASATFIDAAVAGALMREGASFNRIFVPILAVTEGSGGVRATATGGTTSAFGIQDGDVLLRAEGRAITSGQSVLNEVMSRVQRNETVVVEGERNGAPRRWVFAPAACR